MSQEIIKKLETSIDNMKNKKSKVFLIVQDTKGNAKASISYTYRLGMSLKKLGYNPVILHEKPDYIGVGQWLGEEYMKELTHQSIEGQELKVSPEDFIIIPELFGFVMEQISKLPCGKIVLSQSYDYVFETLQPGQTWSQLGIHKCITTSEKQKEYLESIMRNVSYDVLEPYIPVTFSKSTLPSKPIIAIHSRDHRDSINIIKSFYIKFPQYRWITFRDMRTLTEEEFAKGLKDCFASVWVDEISSYGTFPLESIKSGVPVIGVAPNITPDWMNEDNGVWVPNKSIIVDYIADFLQNWLEDNISETLITSMEETSLKLQTEESFTLKVSELFEKYLTTRQTSFEEQLDKLKTTNE
jgi:glycosyltransferase involved in cell wall biosynthesis